MRGFYSSKIYKILPVPLQNAFVSTKGLVYKTVRRGGGFHLFENELAGNEKLSADELISLQLKHLKHVLKRAYEQVPFYHTCFNEIGFSHNDLKHVHDIRKLPIIDKNTVRNHFSQFMAEDARHRHLVKGSTSGSTGTPLSLYMDLKTIMNEYAFVLRQFRWAGFPKQGKIASFRGDMIVPRGQIGPPYWRYDALTKEMWFSSYDLSPHTAESYIAALRKFDPDLIYAYPSSLFTLAQFMKHIGSRCILPSLCGIVTSSETLYRHQRECIEQAFGRPIFDWYGLFERVIFIGTCEFGSYHIFPDYGFTELIPTNGDSNDTQFELVGTGFINHVMPLIRYRTGDLVTLAKSTDCKCGRAFNRVNSILGRIDDVVITGDGKAVGRLDHIFKGVEHIRLAQIVQENKGEVKILVVPESNYDLNDENMMTNNAVERLGKEICLKIILVDNIPSSSNGKFKTVISCVANEKE
jgi:phenylacetate-CoA ligase